MISGKNERSMHGYLVQESQLAEVLQGLRDLEAVDLDGGAVEKGAPSEGAFKK
jgi:hypothetical protein